MTARDENDIATHMTTMVRSAHTLQHTHVYNPDIYIYFEKLLNYKDNY